MFCSEFYSVTLLLSHPGLTNQLPNKLPHKCSQIINNNYKMRVRPTPLHNLLGVSSSNAVACSSCVVVWGLLRVHSRVTTFTPSNASLPYTQSGSKMNTGVLDTTQTEPRLSPAWVQTPTSRSSRMENGQWCFVNM